jgi:hypothetical protein
MSNPIDIFFSYAHEDEKLMHSCRQQLVLFERQELIRKWHDRQIPPGSDWKGQIDERLRAARIILLFISPHFFDSDYCYDAEMMEALRRERSGEARVIPIILRPCKWETSDFSHLQVLPVDGKPVTRWSNQDEAFLNVAEGIMRVVSELQDQAGSQSSTEQDVKLTPKMNLSFQQSVSSPSELSQIEFGISRYCYSGDELVYTIGFVLRERRRRDLEFVDRIKINVRVDSSNHKSAERLMTQRRLSEEQLQFLRGPVTSHAKSLPQGSTHDNELIALLRKALTKK